MFTEVLSPILSNALRTLNQKGLREIRLRVDKPVIVNYGHSFYLGKSGLVENSNNAIKLNAKDLNEIVLKSCEYSVYAYNEEIKNGFITLKNGIRIGLCGEIVFENNVIKTIKNFSSLNIRIPHQVKNCSLEALMFLYNEHSVLNTLIISPPGAGKTTFIRDLCYQYSTKFLAKNILVLDERGEIGCCLNGVPQMELGDTVDILTNCNKLYGLECGIRTMNPEVIFLDEIANISDANALNYAIGSGVKIVATAHSDNLENLYKKPYLKQIMNEKLFDRIVVLSYRNGAGTLENIYDNNNNCLYCAG